MILTYKIKHNHDFSHELRLAQIVARIAVRTKSTTSKDVKHVGLNSMIANAILRKYSRDKKVKQVRNVPLVIPKNGVMLDKKNKVIWLPCLKIGFGYRFCNDFDTVCQIEIHKEFAFVSINVRDMLLKKVGNYIGVDRNAVGHSAVVGNPKTGKVMKLGKKAHHIRRKYKNMGKGVNGKALERIKVRRKNIIKDLNHKISRKIVDVAYINDDGIKLEHLRYNKKWRSLNSWSYYQLGEMIDYKAKLLGVPVVYVDPAYTSQNCSRCGWLGNRRDKKFKCPHCGHVDHADANASFNIAMRDGRLYADRDVYKGNTGVPEKVNSKSI